MSVELASIASNLSKIAAKAARDDQSLVEELSREVHRLCAVVQKLEQANKVRTDKPADRAGSA